LWPHPTPGDHDINKLAFALSESFNVKFSFSGFIGYLPFEEDMAAYHVYLKKKKT
jgi:hypothetical protein